MYGLTRKQLALLKYVQGYVADNSYSPSYQEMMDALGIKSKSNVHRYIQILHERGHISRVYGRARTILPVSVPAHP